MEQEDIILNKYAIVNKYLLISTCLQAVTCMDMEFILLKKQAILSHMHFRKGLHNK